MYDIQSLVTDNIDIWTSSIKQKSSAGRGNSKKINLHGIQKLRELISELAIRGKLVPQDPNEEPASILLKKIETEKRQLVKEGKLKKPKQSAKISEEEKFFKLPEGWAWVRLGEVGNIFNGNSINSSLKEEKYTGIEGLPFIATKDVEYGFESLTYDNGVAIPIGEDKFKVARKGAVLMCAEGGSAGKKCGITDRDICFGNKLFANELFGTISSFYILITYLSPTFYKLFTGLMTGIIGGVSALKFGEILIPLPPLSEQNRIAHKVDELMALCSQLEKQTEESIYAHELLVTALLTTLTQSQDAEELSQNWARISDLFDTLFSTEYSIDQLKQTILQLAMMGKLVPQDPNDEPTAILLKKIAAEKEQLIKEGKMKKQKPLPTAADNKEPFKLPESWSFVCLQDLCELITDGTHQTPQYTESGRPFISAQCVKPFVFMPDKCRYVSEEHYQNYIKNRKPEYKDILLSRVGAGIGEAALIDVELEFAIYVSTGLLKPFKRAVLPEYLVLWLNSPVGRQYSEKNTYGKGVSQGNLNLSLIRSFLVSLPPLAEQLRIIAKVDKIMEMCDQLKKRLSGASAIQNNLANIIVEKAVA